MEPCTKKNKHLFQSSSCHLLNLGSQQQVAIGVTTQEQFQCFAPHFSADTSDQQRSWPGKFSTT